MNVPAFIFNHYVPHLRSLRPGARKSASTPWTSPKIKDPKELGKVKARLECLLDHSPAALYSRCYTDCCELIYLSKNILNLTGFSRKRSWPTPSFGPSISTRRTVSCLLKLTAPGSKLCISPREYRFLHRDGTYRWLHDEFNLVRDQTRRTTGIYRFFNRYHCWPGGPGDPGASAKNAIGPLWNAKRT